MLIKHSVYLRKNTSKEYAKEDKEQIKTFSIFNGKQCSLVISIAWGLKTDWIASFIETKEWIGIAVGGKNRS